MDVIPDLNYFNITNALQASYVLSTIIDLPYFIQNYVSYVY